MATFNGKEINKNTVVGVSVGTLFAIFLSVWTILGIGRPLFASDLKSIAHDIDSLVAVIDKNQTSTAIQILSIRKEALQTELRSARREARLMPGDPGAMEDIRAIEDDIADIDQKILCYRTVTCIVEPDF